MTGYVAALQAWVSKAWSVGLSRKRVLVVAHASGLCIVIAHISAQTTAFVTREIVGGTFAAEMPPSLHNLKRLLQGTDCYQGLRAGRRETESHQYHLSGPLQRALSDVHLDHQVAGGFAEIRD